MRAFVFATHTLSYSRRHFFFRFNLTWNSMLAHFFPIRIFFFVFFLLSLIHTLARSLFTFTADWEMYVAAIHSIYIYYINKKTGRWIENSNSHSRTHTRAHKQIPIFQLLRRIFFNFQCCYCCYVAVVCKKEKYIFAFIPNTGTVIGIIITTIKKEKKDSKYSETTALDI